MAGVAGVLPRDQGTAWTGGPSLVLLGVAGWMNEYVDGCMDTWGGREGGRDGSVDTQMHGHTCG